MTTVTDTCPRCGCAALRGRFSNSWACGSVMVPVAAPARQVRPTARSGADVVGAVAAPSIRVSQACTIIASFRAEIATLRDRVVEIPTPSQEEWWNMILVRGEAGPVFNAAHEHGMRDALAYARKHARIVPKPVHLPCPWCGSEPESQPWHGGGPDKTLIACGNEACAVAPSVSGETIELAWAAWDSRKEVSRGQGI